MDNMLYYAGLVLVSSLVFMGIDDLLWDIFTIKAKSNYEDKRVPLEELDEKAPRMLALIIASWHEDAVLGDVVENIIASVHYPRSMYHIFLGVYTNDPNTSAIAELLAEKHQNIHVVYNAKLGPTSKADNINNVFKHARRFELENSISFAGITVHDAEDIMHPYELKITNYLYEQYPAMQFPVFPLQEMPKLKNLFSNMTVGTYADEFAENHYRTMVLRDSSGAFVPSAGTGFAISHRVLETFALDEDIFPADSLTEDYKMALTIQERGFRVHYMLEKLQRLRHDGSLVWEYVATRSRFPGTFKAAVKQKTRWIYGITMQSFNFIDIFRSQKPLIFRYTMYKDWKAKLANLLALPGYAVFIYVVCSFFFTLPPIYPYKTLSWWLCVVLTLMMLERQILRAVAIKNVYGLKSAIIACFLPPVIPFRLVWGNIINFVATVNAWEKALIRTKPQKINAHKVSEWNKTDHEFLPQPVLRRFHRNLGDVLLEKQYITPEMLKEALDISLQTKKRIGVVLREKNHVSEETLLRAIAWVHQTLFVPLAPSMIVRDFAVQFKREDLEELIAFPLLINRDVQVFALSDDSPAEALTTLASMYNLHNLMRVYATREAIMTALDILYSNQLLPGDCQRIQELFAHNKITYEQALLAQSFQSSTGLAESELIATMGIFVPLVINNYAPITEEVL